MSYFKAKKRQIVEQTVGEANFDFPKFARTRETGDRIFLINNGKYHWIENPETYTTLGGKFGQEQVIPYPMLKLLISGSPINMQNVKEYAKED